MLSPASSGTPTLARGERTALPVAIRLAPASSGAAELVVTVRVDGATIRSRLLSIQIRPPSTPERQGAQEKPGAQPAQPADREHTLTGSDGQPVHFMPANQPPAAPRP